jgi:endonuclease YncB( thermonuclease family)
VPTVVQFRNPPRQQARTRPSRTLPYALGLLVIAAVWGLVQFPIGPHLARRAPPTAGDALTQSFALCGVRRRDNCVIDGDTFAYQGHSIRIADIDAPETHPARCDEEKRLGTQATDRLQELLNAGPFTLISGSRDTDRYGRKLRTVMRDGRSLGGVLVSEGLARQWTGRRRPWCT